MTDELKPESEIVSQAQELIGSVDYQPDSIVSRTLVNKENGSITVFAFDAGQGLSEHVAPFDALVYIFDGETEIKVSGKPVHLKEGMLTILPAGKSHSVRAVNRFKMMLIMIRS
jgi:quercetin dioxygenase-like cupin family protein